MLFVDKAARKLAFSHFTSNSSSMISIMGIFKSDL